MMKSRNCKKKIIVEEVKSFCFVIYTQKMMIKTVISKKKEDCIFLRRLFNNNNNKRKMINSYYHKTNIIIYQKEEKIEKNKGREIFTFYYLLLQCKFSYTPGFTSNFCSNSFFCVIIILLVLFS